MNCEEFNEISGAFSLGGITPTERAEARAHLQNCENCTKLWLEQRAIVDLLPLTVSQIDPPEELKERLLARIRNEPKPASLGKPIPIPIRQPDKRRNRVTKRNWWLVAAMVFLLCLSVGVSIWSVSLKGLVAARDQQIASNQQQMSTLIKRVHVLRGQITKVFTLKGQQGTASAVGDLLYVPQNNLTVITVRGLPAPQGVEVYQGWLMQNKHATSIGQLFIQNGLASLTYYGDITAFDLAAVSLEPGPTLSPHTPSGPLVALGTLKG